jgi:hypothetical protein
MVTSRKRSVTSAGSGWPQGEVWWSKSREEPGAHKQRHPVKQRQISIFGETGSTQFFERGFGPALFFEQLEKINARISFKTTRP